MFGPEQLLAAYASGVFPMGESRDDPKLYWLDPRQRAVLPLEELRQFSDVFGAIKANYVEQVEDKKLITEAISGMISGLDPHSAYLDADAFRELQVGTQGESYQGVCPPLLEGAFLRAFENGRELEPFEFGM